MLSSIKGLWLLIAYVIILWKIRISYEACLGITSVKASWCYTIPYNSFKLLQINNSFSIAILFFHIMTCCCYYKILAKWPLRNKNGVKFNSKKLRYHLQFPTQFKSKWQQKDAIQLLSCCMCSYECSHAFVWQKNKNQQGKIGTMLLMPYMLCHFLLVLYQEKKTCHNSIQSK